MIEGDFSAGELKGLCLASSNGLLPEVSPNFVVVSDVTEGWIVNIGKALGIVEPDSCRLLRAAVHSAQVRTRITLPSATNCVPN